MNEVYDINGRQIPLAIMMKGFILAPQGIIHFYLQKRMS